MDALTVPGTLDSLAAIRTFVNEMGEKAGLDRKALYRLKLAVDEIATNIVTYGYENAGLRGDIVISAHLQPSVLFILVARRIGFRIRSVLAIHACPSWQASESVCMT